jgi:hypothetical protein
VADWLEGGGPGKVSEIPYRRGIENRSLELEFMVEESKVRGNQVVVKVVDIFGNDTNKLVEVESI